MSPLSQNSGNGAEMTTFLQLEMAIEREDLELVGAWIQHSLLSSMQQSYLNHRYLSTHTERVLCKTFLRPIMYWPKMGIVKTIWECGAGLWELISWLFFVIQAVGLVGHSHSM